MIQTVLIRIGLAAVIFGLGAWLGYSYERNDCKADQAVAQTESIEAHDQAAEAGRVVEQLAVQRSAKTDAVFNGIQQGVITYVQKHPAADDCRLDADGLRLWNDANAGADPQPATERYAGMRVSPTAAEQRNGGSSDQPYRRGQGISPLPGSAQGLGQLAGKDK